MKKKFTFLMAALMLLTMMVLPWKAVGQDTYSKVTSVSGINTTDTYIIVCEDSNVAMKVYSSGDNNHKTVSATINNGSASSVGNDVCLLTLESTGTANQYYLKNQNNQYLLAVSGQNYLKAQNSKADACKFTLSYSGEVLTITSTVAPKSGSWNPSRMRYNSSSSCFACYGTGQNAIAIYKKNLPKLATPTNFHATAGDEQAEFSWNAVEHAISYTIAYTPAGGTEQTITDITGTSRIITGLTNDLEYSCKIKAVGDGTSYSDSDYSSTISVTPTGSTTFTVTYDCNGGTSGCPDNVTGINPNTEITLAAAPSRTGHAFNGWKNGTTTYAAGDFYNVTGNVTMTAQWTAYTVTAQSNNNSYGTVSVSDFTITASPASGYQYATPAYTVSSGSASVVQDGNTFTVTPSSNCTVTINFEAIPTHAANFSVNGDITSSQVAEGAAITFPADPADINDKTFVGWTASAISGTTDTPPTFVTSATMNNSDVTFYAVFADVSDQEETLTITNSDFTTNLSGSYGSASIVKTIGESDYTIDLYACTQNSMCQLRASEAYIQIPTLPGKITNISTTACNNAGESSYTGTIRLKSAYAAGNTTTYDIFTKELSSVYLFSINVTDNITSFYFVTSAGLRVNDLSVTYEVISYSDYCTTVPVASTWTVTYEGNGKTSGTVPVDATVYDADNNTVTVLGNTGNLEKTGHTWNGWNTEADYTGDSYTENEQFTISESTTLYAQWMINSYSYTLNVIGDDAGALAELEVDGSTAGATIQYGKEVEVVVVTNTGYVYSISVKDANNNDIAVTNDKFNMPASAVTVTVTSRQLNKYSLVTSNTPIKPGKHYIFVGKNDDDYYAMGKDRGNNRLGVSVIYDDDNEKIIEAEGLYEFIISGSNDDGCYYTIYDENTLGLNESNTHGYLYAPGVGTSGNNYLRTRTSNSTNEGQGQWTITIADGNLASIVANVSTDNARIYMKYNHNGGNPDMFSCYGTSGANIYIYEKDGDNDCHIYSATNINDMTVSGDMTIHSGVVTVATNETLTVNGTLTNNTASNLVLNDGAQLYTSTNNVKATIEKTIAAAANNSDENWYLISSPVGTVSTDVVTTGHICNLYAYNEKDLKWNGYAGSNGFSSLASGIGYLYRKADADAISFAGTVTTGALSPIALSYERDDAFAGFNLLGNPYSHNLQSNCISLTNGATFSGVYTLGVDGNWYSSVLTDIKPCEGFLVQVDKETSATFSELAKGATYNNDYIQFNVANSQYEDVAYALFNDSKGLTKINHRNADIPMLYINKKGIDYAIATMSDDTKSFDLSFKAMTTGKYTLSYKANGEFSYLHIIDRLTGADVDMLLEGEYSFIATPIDQNDRFIVKLGYSPEYGDASNDIFAFQSGNEIFVSGSGELQIFDVTGRKVMTTTINGAKSISVTAPGIYIFRLVGTEVKTQKIVVR